MAGAVTTLSDSTFDETVASDGAPVLVDFWAEWCGPCKMIAPILEEIADEQGEALQVAKLNVDEAGDIARRFEVMSIPTLILFCLLYTSPSPRDLSTSRMPSSA